VAYLWCAQPRGVPKILFRGLLLWSGGAAICFFFFFSFCISCWPTIEKTGIRDAAPCETARAFPPSSFSLTLSVCKIFCILYFSLCVCVTSFNLTRNSGFCADYPRVCVCVCLLFRCVLVVHLTRFFWRSFLSDVFSWLNWIYSFLLFGLKILPCGVVRVMTWFPFIPSWLLSETTTHKTNSWTISMRGSSQDCFALRNFWISISVVGGIIIGDPVVCSKTRVVSFTGRTAGRWPANPVNREFLLLTILLPMLRPSDQSLCGSRGQIAMVIKSPSLVFCFLFFFV
jgi:hypothetical protein